MSRSYKKTPVNKKNMRFFKNYANRVIRKTTNWIPNGKSYRKLFCSWRIADWRMYETIWTWVQWNSFHASQGQFGEDGQTFEEAVEDSLDRYEKDFVRK